MRGTVRGDRSGWRVYTIDVVARMRLYGSKPGVRYTDSIIDQQPRGSLKWYIGTTFTNRASSRFARSAVDGSVMCDTRVCEQKYRLRAVETLLVLPNVSGFFCF